MLLSRHPVCGIDTYKITDLPIQLLQPTVVECPRPTNASFQPVFNLGEVDVHRPISLALSDERQSGSASVDVLTSLFLSDVIIESIVERTNKYIATRLVSHQRQPTIQLHEIYQFVAIIYYLGIVYLPCKYDLWAPHQGLPTHTLASENGMTKEKFQYICRNISFSRKDIGNGLDGGETSSEESEQSGSESNIQTTEDVATTAGEAPEAVPNVGRTVIWFGKVYLLIEHVREVSLNLSSRPGFELYVDEMMVRFTERSVETHRMKNKPISEGHNFFAIVDVVSEYVMYFVPDGRLDSHREVGSDRGANEYSANADVYRKAAVNKLLVEKVTDVHCQKGIPFVAAIDKYFTLSKVMPMLREKRTGCLGTA